MIEHFFKPFARFREFLCFFSLSSLFRSFGGFSERESARGDGEYNKVFGLLIDDGIARKCAAIGCDEERRASSQILKAMMTEDKF